MDDWKRMRPIERLRYLRASYKLTIHDAKLFGNDAVVHNVATQLFLAMEEHGIPKIAAAMGNQRCLGYKHTAETKAKMSAAQM